MKKVYLVDAKRTAIGGFMGSLSATHPADFSVAVIESILKNTKIPAEKIEQLICGNVLSAGLGQGIARQIAIKSGMSKNSTALSINMICGSGLKSVMLASNEIRLGNYDLIIAGGAENMSMAPYLDKNVRNGNKLGAYTNIDHILNDALTDAFQGIHMGVTAENIAKKYNISREEQDNFAIESQRKALLAIENGYFKNEIVDTVVSDRKSSRVFNVDEFPKSDTSIEKMSKLKPIFEKEGTVTAANASGINDGAAFILLASEEAIAKYNLKPLAEIVGYAESGVDPSVMGLGPVTAIIKSIEVSNLNFNQISKIELNEAFAAQSLGVVKELSTHYSCSAEEILKITNVNGGAIALGHPVGASGSRILTSLVHELIRSNEEYGVASLCIGGGMGVSLVIKRLSYE